MNFLITFIILSIINVIFSTVRSLTTIKSGKTVASLISGGYFAFYNIVLVYTVIDYPMWAKCVITFICNVIGVWIVKLIEEKARKDKLWLIQVTFKINQTQSVIDFLNSANIPYSYIIEKTKKYSIFNIYCSTQRQSAAVNEIIKTFNAKYFASEGKTL